MLNTHKPITWRRGPLALYIVKYRVLMPSHLHSSLLSTVSPKPTIMLPVKYTNAWSPKNKLLCPASWSLHVTLTQRCFVVSQKSGSDPTGSWQRFAVSPFTSFSDLLDSHSPSFFAVTRVTTDPDTVLTPSMQITNSLCDVTLSSVVADVYGRTCSL